MLDMDRRSKQGPPIIIKQMKSFRVATADPGSSIQFLNATTWSWWGGRRQKKTAWAQMLRTEKSHCHLTNDTSFEKDRSYSQARQTLQFTVVSSQKASVKTFSRLLLSTRVSWARMSSCISNPDQPNESCYNTPIMFKMWQCVLCNFVPMADSTRDCY